jgi:hypothetical protein
MFKVAFVEIIYALFWYIVSFLGLSIALKETTKRKIVIAVLIAFVLYIVELVARKGFDFDASEKIERFIFEDVLCLLPLPGCKPGEITPLPPPPPPEPEPDPAPQPEPKRERQPEPAPPETDPIVPVKTDHAVRGVRSGMSCDDAQAIFGRLYACTVNGKQYELIKREEAEQQTSIEGQPLIVQQQIIRSDSNQHRDTMSVACSLPASGEQVYHVAYYKPFAPDERPTIKALEQQVSQTYGGLPYRYQSERKPIVLGAFFSGQGTSTTSDSACGRFAYNTPEGAIAQVVADIDVSACSYALYVMITPARDEPDRVDALRVQLWDYARFVATHRQDEGDRQKQHDANPGTAPDL